MSPFAHTSLSRAEARFYELLRSWVGREDALRFIWQVLNTRPAIEGREPRLWFVPSATKEEESYMVDDRTRAFGLPIQVLQDTFRKTVECGHIEMLLWTS